MRIKLTLIVLAVAVFMLSIQRSQPVAEAAERGRATTYQFIEVETTVHLKGVETSDEHPEERRWYFSSVIVMPEDVPSYSLIKKKFIPYFSKNVMDPAELRGILIDYSDQDVRMNGESSYTNYETKAEAETERAKAIEYRKEQGGNIYSFEIDFKDPKGEATSKPKLIYRDKNQKKNYEKAN